MDLKQEFVKCAKDPVYFINNYCKTYNIFSQKIDNIKCFPYQEKLIEKYQKHRNNIVLKSRQTGISVITAAYVTWRLVFRPNQSMLIIANNYQNSIKFLKHVKEYYFTLPNFLRIDNNPPINNQRQIKLKNGSTLIAKAPTPDAGRGESLHLLILDEMAFIENAEEIWKAAGIALSVTGGKCIMISTPNGTDNLYYQIWSQAIEKDGNYSEIDFIPTIVHWTENPFCASDLKIIEKDGKKEYWSSWYENEKKRLNYDKVKIAQELDLSFEGSKNSAIDEEVIINYEKKLMIPDYKEIIENKKYYDFSLTTNRFVNYETDFHIYKLPEEDGDYIISCDVSRGDSNDYTAIIILDNKNLEIVGDFFGKVPVESIAQIIYNAANDYNKAFVAVEANSFGLAVALDLKNKFEYQNLYYSQSLKDIYVFKYFYSIKKDERIPGFQTTKKTRPLLISSLKNYLREGELKIYSKRIINQFRSFIYNENKDRMEAERGMSDDLIMALSIALFIRDTEYTKHITQTKILYKDINYMSKEEKSFIVEEFYSLKSQEDFHEKNILDNFAKELLSF